MSLEAGASKHISVRSIESVTPTLAELLRACNLRAALSQCQNVGDFTLGNPKAWLGTAYHKVLAAAQKTVGTNLEDLITTAWRTAIGREDLRAKNHPLDKRFGPPETWPGYHRIAAMARVRGKEFGATGLHDPKERTKRTRQNASGPLLEQRLSAAEGRIVGIPDVVREGTILDFKTGHLFEKDHEVVRLAYVRKLRLYAFLVKETLGWWPRTGILVPMIGSRVEVDLDPTECTQQSIQTIELLDGLNEAVSHGADANELADPSATACCWCPFQIMCQAFWKHVGPDWAGKLGAASVFGIVPCTPQEIQYGSALSVPIQIQGGTEICDGMREIAPIDVSVQLVSGAIQKGDEVRITGLWKRSDGTLSVTRRTVFARVQDLPVVTVQPEP